MIVTTKSGTKYRIDLEAKTWQRLEATYKSGHLRTEFGKFIGIEGLAVGCGMIITCPPITPRASARVIYTTQVVAIEDECPDSGRKEEKCL